MPIMLTRKTSPAWFGKVVAVTGKGGGQQRVAKKGFKKGTYRVWSGEQTRTRHLRAKMVRTAPHRYLSGTIQIALCQNYARLCSIMLVMPILCQLCFMLRPCYYANSYAGIIRSPQTHVHACGFWSPLGRPLVS